MTDMGWILVAALFVGAAVAFFTKWPFCREFFMRDMVEGELWPWWYGETVRFRAASTTAVMIPFHLLVRWGWRFYSWIRWNDKDCPDSLRMEHLEMRNRYLNKELEGMVKNRDEAVLRCWELAGKQLIPPSPRDNR
jgi:hypothetical protein